jgi:hypothetical protein
MAHSDVDTGASRAERTLTMARAGREAVISEMRRNPNMFLIGEDIAKLGGVFGTSIGMADEFGTERIIDTPISETGFIGIATGGDGRHAAGGGDRVRGLYRRVLQPDL